MKKVLVVILIFLTFYIVDNITNIEKYEGYNKEKGVNHPVLLNGMTPIKWGENNEETETTEDDSDWYDYNEKKWANAKSGDGSYWVWIPRYAYKITSGYHDNNRGTIDIKFLKGNSNISKDKTDIQNSSYNYQHNNTSMNYFLHPAFQFDGEKLGFWIAKFEPSIAEENHPCNQDSNPENCNNSSLTPKIIPNTLTWRNIDTKTAYEVSLNMKDKTNIYGWNKNEVDTHLITNLEWGAVAYLSASKYGADKEVWNNSYNGYVSGCSGSSVNAFDEPDCISYDTENGMKASTTYNIYGIYDMAGGAYERVMANYNNMVGISGFNNGDEIALINPKYIDKYFTYEKDYLNEIGFSYDLSKYGDAVYETSSGAARWAGDGWEGITPGSWDGSRSRLPYKYYPWFARGGCDKNGSHAGIFDFSFSAGNPATNSSFRIVLMPAL